MVMALVSKEPTEDITKKPPIKPNINFIIFSLNSICTTIIGVLETNVNTSFRLFCYMMGIIMTYRYKKDDIFAIKQLTLFPK